MFYFFEVCFTAPIRSNDEPIRALLSPRISEGANPNLARKRFASREADAYSQSREILLSDEGAVVFALVMPAVQIAYTEFWRVPADNPATQAALTELRTDIVELQTTQQEALALLSQSLESSNEDMTSVLRDLHSILCGVVPQSPAQSPPPPLSAQGFEDSSINGGAPVPAR